MNDATNIIAAIPDAWTIGFPIAVLLLQIAQAVITAVLASRASEVRTLRDSLEKAVGEIIEQKLSLITHRIVTIESRLLAGDGHLKRLDERDHELRVEVLKALGELKDVVATKDDLHRMREELKRD